MWTLKKIASLRLPLGLIGEVIRLTNKSREEGRFLVKKWRELTLATQNPSGRSLAARLVRTHHLRCWQVVWVFKSQGSKRKWLYFIAFDPDKKIIWVGEPKDQKKILGLLTGEQQSLF